MKLFSTLFPAAALASCPTKWTLDASTGNCVPDGAFSFTCNGDGTVDLTLEIEHFYTNIPADTTSLVAGLVNDGWTQDSNERG